MGLNLITKLPFQVWGGELVKAGADKPVPAYSLSGKLYLSNSGWLLLHVPNALVRGVFDAMHEPGIQLPSSGPDNRLNAHISIMRPEELEQITGGADAVTERDQRFTYTLGRLVSVNPEGWSAMNKCWFLQVHSPELRALRKSYGLSGLLGDDTHPFHITVACRRVGVMGNNSKSKVT